MTHPPPQPDMPDAGDSPRAPAAVPADRLPSETSGLTDTFYGELRDIALRSMRSERSGHTLQPTAVANEACLRLLRSGLPPIPREQQLAIAARVLEQVLIDHARRRSALKRGGPGLGSSAPHTPNAHAAPAHGAPGELASVHTSLRVAIDPGLLAADAAQLDIEDIHAALTRLRSLHARQGEVVTLRIFAGLGMEQIASVLGLSKRTIEADWAVARAWLRRELRSAETRT